MKQRDLKLLLDSGLVASVCVVPIPPAGGWRVEARIEAPAGAAARVAILESDRSSLRRRVVRRFATLDSAARFLHRLGIEAFRVEPAHALSLAEATGVAPDLDEVEAAPPRATPHA